METNEIMSKYETVSTVLSIIAISLSILIPLVQWVYKKWILTAILKFYPTGQATLFLNQSGSYIRLKLKEYYRQPVFFKTPLVEISEE